ncbi:BON domain-containing protein [Mycobacterium sp. pR1184]|uniref:channel-forming protein ArfA/OmpATb n=1 Tax=Mycobacterium sp. pR1184 TaxID=3238981 RepID=UPI00351B781E
MGLGGRFGRPAETPRRTPICYRRSLGMGWLIGVVVIPLLIAAIGYAPSGTPHPPPVVASPGNPGKPPLSLAPLSIVRNGNDITLTGEFPDDSAKAVLTRVLKGALPAGISIIDRIQIDPNVDALDFSNAGTIFKNSASITDFGLTVNGGTISLTGTAASQDQKNTIAREATHTWSNLTVVDQLAVDRTPMVAPRNAGSKSYVARQDPAWIS